MGQKFNWGRAFGSGLSTLGSELSRIEQEKRRRQEEIDAEQRQYDNWVKQRQYLEGEKNRLDPVVNVAGPSFGVPFGSGRVSMPSLPMRASEAAPLYSKLYSQFWQQKPDATRQTNPAWEMVPAGSGGNPWGFPATRGSIEDHYLQQSKPYAGADPLSKPGAYRTFAGDTTAAGNFDQGALFDARYYDLYGPEAQAAYVAELYRRGIDPTDAVAAEGVLRDVVSGRSPDFEYGGNGLSYDPGKGVLYDPHFVKKDKFLGFDRLAKDDWYKMDAEGNPVGDDRPGTPYVPYETEQYIALNVLPALEAGYVNDRQVIAWADKLGIPIEKLSELIPAVKARVNAAPVAGAESTGGAKFNPYSTWGRAPYLSPDSGISIDDLF